MNLSQFEKEQNDEGDYTRRTRHARTKAGPSLTLCNSPPEALDGFLQKVVFTETEGLPWAEIDDANDRHYAQTTVYPALKPMMADMEPIEMELEFQSASLVTCQCRRRCMK